MTRKVTAQKVHTIPFELEEDADLMVCSYNGVTCVGVSSDATRDEMFLIPVGLVESFIQIYLAYALQEQDELKEAKDKGLH